MPRITDNTSTDSKAPLDAPQLFRIVGMKPRHLRHCVSYESEDSAALAYRLHISFADGFDVFRKA